LLEVLKKSIVNLIKIKIINYVLGLVGQVLVVGLGLEG